MTYLASPWVPSPLCIHCINYLIDTQWEQHLEMVKKVDCRRAAIAICRNVPLYVHERTAFACPCHQHGETPATDGEQNNAKTDDVAETCPLKGQIELLWRADDNTEIVPILKDAKQGQSRLDYIAELEEFAQAFEQDKKEEMEQLAQPQVVDSVVSNDTAEQETQ